MLVTSYLQIDGIKGESTDSEHKDWIEIRSFTRSVTLQSPSKTAQPEAPAPRVIVTKLTDSTSVQLYQFCSSGKHIKKVVIELMRTSGNTAVRYMTIELDEVLISSITHSNDSEGVPTDLISFSEASLETTFHAPPEISKPAWNVIRNTKL